MRSVYRKCAAGRDAICGVAWRAIVARCRRALTLAPVAGLLVALAPGAFVPAAFGPGAFGQALEPGASEAQAYGETTDDAWAAYDRGDYVAARRIFEQRVADGDADAAYGLAIMNANGMGGVADPGAAAELYGMAASAGNAEAASALGYHYDFGLGVPLNKDLAEYWYRKAVDGGSLLGMNNLAYSWIEQRRHLRDALDMIREVVAAGMIDSATLDTLGWGLYELGAYREALPPLCQAVLLEPNHPELRTHLGDAYWRAGRAADARKQWQEALMLEANPHLLSPTGADFMQAEPRGEWRSRLADRIARGLAGPNRPRGDIGAPGIESEFTDDCAIPMS
ncbi:MAG: tetratricopeptide repeat protein [Dongiaceae bacterium]